MHEGGGDLAVLLEVLDPADLKVQMGYLSYRDNKFPFCSNPFELGFVTIKGLLT